jgi:hypothetical protein
MAGENAQSRIYLGIHWQFDAVEGIRSGDGIGDYVFTHALRLRNAPPPMALPSMDPLAQIQLAVSLEDVAAHGGLPMAGPTPLLDAAPSFVLSGHPSGTSLHPGTTGHAPPVGQGQVQQFVSQLISQLPASPSIAWQHDGSGTAEHGQDARSDDVLTTLFDKL